MVTLGCQAAQDPASLLLEPINGSLPSPPPPSMPRMPLPPLPTPRQAGLMSSSFLWCRVHKFPSFLCFPGGAALRSLPPPAPRHWVNACF